MECEKINLLSKRESRKTVAKAEENDLHRSRKDKSVVHRTGALERSAEECIQSSFLWSRKMKRRKGDQRVAYDSFTRLFKGSKAGRSKA